MVEKFSSSVLGCINQCNWQNLSINQVVPTGIGFFEEVFTNEMGECEECKARFSIFRRKKMCYECGLNYCTSCIKRLNGGSRVCKKCTILSHWPICRSEIASLRVRDLRHYLATCKIPTNTCTEKQDLIDLVIVQLKIKRMRTSRIYQPDITGFETETSESNPVTDDGIRVRPQVNEPSSSGLPPVSEQSDGGIRVFASSHLPERELASLHSGVPVCTNEDDSDSSSSSWSLVNLGEGPDRSSSSDSISQSLTSDNIPANIPPANEENILEEITTTDPDTNEQRSEDTLPPTHQASNVQPSTKMVSSSEVVKLSSLETEESIKGLSVRQCKEILTLHRVDFSGIWEKHELVNKVKMLWRDYKQRQEEGELSEEQLCKICMDAAMDCVLLECGHIVSCTNCGKQMAECPVCRQNVIRVVKTFRA